MPGGFYIPDRGQTYLCVGLVQLYIPVLLKCIYSKLSTSHGVPLDPSRINPIQPMEALQTDTEYPDCFCSVLHGYVMEVMGL